jgi:menaquinone-dependent protoporphyrinogen oxidase
MTNEQPTSRRRFLRKGCITAAAMGIALCGGGTFALTYQPPVEKPELILGDEAMQNRTLVAYATKAGSTAEIAARIGEKISQKNQPVDVLPISKVKDLNSYSAVIIGSAIRMGSVLPEVKSFIENNQAALGQKPFSMFVACMTLNEDTEANRATVSAYLDPIRAVVKPSSEGLFAGVIDPSKVSFLDRLIIKAIKPPIGDFRNWDKIDAWAENIPL